jgi:hypothetical protein
MRCSFATQLFGDNVMFDKLLSYSRVLFLGACALLAGCVSPTPYQAAVSGSRLGYVDKQIDGDIFRVSFVGNGRTPIKRVQAFTLYRCAELAQEKGYDGFKVVDGNLPRTLLLGEPAEKTSGSSGGEYSRDSFVVSAGYDELESVTLNRLPVAIEAGFLVKTKGGAAPTYIYVPSTPVYIPSVVVTIKLVKAPLAEERSTFSAQEVVTRLAPIIERSKAEAETKT